MKQIRDNFSVEQVIGLSGISIAFCSLCLHAPNAVSAIGLLVAWMGMAYGTIATAFEISGRGRFVWIMGTILAVCGLSWLGRRTVTDYATNRNELVFIVFSALVISVILFVATMLVKFALACRRTQGGG